VNENVLKNVAWYESKYFDTFFMKVIHKIFGRNFIKNIVDKTADVCVISYPKAGRTWLRIMLTEYLLRLEGQGNKHRVTSLFDVHYRNRNVPLISVTHDTIDLGGGTKHRARSFYENKKIILLIRGIKDLIVSYYYQEIARNIGFKGPISDFIRNPKFGVNRVINFYNAWYRDRELVDDFCIIAYENLKNDTEHELEILLKFIGLPVDRKAIKFAIEESSFDKLYTAQFSTDLSYLKAYNQDPRSLKVRKGKVGGYKEVLSEEDVHYINEQCKKIDGNVGGLVQ